MQPPKRAQTDESDDDEPGPAPPPSNDDATEGTPEEPEYDPSEDDDDDLPQFPITHEISLKDHTKVVSALAIDPSGARIISGSYDYDCKLWDFGGMDMRCKPFKSWEPAGTYYVRFLWFAPSIPSSITKGGFIDTRPQVLQRRLAVFMPFRHDTGQAVR